MRTIWFSISAITISIVFGACSAVQDMSTIETIDTVKGWASPGWGYNGPKIVRNDKGELWTVSFSGTYGNEKAQILKRSASGEWVKGREFSHLYQPSMLFLDHEGRLNYLQNAQTDSITQYRSVDDENLQNFEMVARGNGIPDGRGWYVGIGVQDSTVYMAYVTLQYDLYLTWKNVTAHQWQPAVLIEPGKVDTVTGNHSWLYPRFLFRDGKGYITVSSTVDGSKYNTYDKVRLVTFSLEDPSRFNSEIVYDGAVGYYSYSYDAVITKDGSFICGHSAGKHRYGAVRPDVVPEGIYVSVKRPGQKQWELIQVENSAGGISLHEGPAGQLYAVVTKGSWDLPTTVLLKVSNDGGRLWKTVNENLLGDQTARTYAFFGQVLHSHSGSTVPTDVIHGMITNHTNVKPVEGVYTFEMMHLNIPLRP